MLDNLGDLGNRPRIIPFSGFLWLIVFPMLKTESHTLHIGESAPAFELPTAERTMIRLSEYAGKPLVLVFIRGTW